MSDAPEPPDREPPDLGDGRESVPLLLARTTSRIRVKERVAPRPSEARKAGTVVRAALPAIARSKLGAAGMLVAALLFLVAIFADLIAADAPLLCKLHGHLYVLPAVTQPAEVVRLSHEEIAREADFAIFAPIAHGPSFMGARVLLPPGSDGHLLGTDREGHDVLSRVVHGTRSYLFFALAAVLAALFLGGALGGISGILGGPTDALVGRVIETVSAFPPLVFVIGVQAAVPHATLATLFFAIAVTRWPEIARLVRAEVMSAATRDYVLAARALGAAPLRVLRKHVAPNVRGPLVVAGAAAVSAVVLTEASLDFLRVGAQGADAASWGETMSEFRDAPGAWWLLAFPGVMLVATIASHTLLGEALRDRLDPRAR